MFFILKLMLVILLNETYAYITQDIETILLPTLNSTSAEEVREFYCVALYTHCLTFQILFQNY